LRQKDFFRSHVCVPVRKGIPCAQNGLCESTCTFGREVVNKAELIEALAARLGDKRTATQALDAVLAEIQAAVTKGDRVAITGFGAFEKRVRGARTARNPRTGEAVKVKKTSVPAFKAGAGFKDMVASGRVPKAAAAKKTTAAKSTATKATATKATATKATATKSSSRSTAAKSTATKAAKSTAAKSTKATPARSAAKSTAKKAPAKAAKTSAATKSTARATTTAKATKSAAKAPAKKAPARKR
jgi:DNA-binding protein HU-beta